MNISSIDICIIGIYMIAMIILGIKLGKKNESQEDYFLAGRNMPFFPVGLSIIATMVSAASFIGAPGGSYNSGLSYFMINANIPLVLFIASGVFIPFMYNLKVTSCYEYLGQRFGTRIRIICSIAFIVNSVMLIGIMIYGPAMILNRLTGWDISVIIPVLILIVIIYTLTGGISAVIWTDAIQMIVLWVGIAACIILAINDSGLSFWESLTVAQEAGKLNALNFSPDITVQDTVWVSIFGIGIFHLQYFTCDQSQVQRMFTSRSVKNMKKSFLLSGIVINIQFALFMIIGLVLFASYGGREFSDANSVMIEFISTKIPQGIFGLILAALLAATMSSIDSLLNSMSTVFVKDIYEPYRRNKDKNKDFNANLSISRWITFVFAIFIFIFTYFGLSASTSPLVTMMGEYCSYITGSILGVFILAMFTNKANEKGTILGFISGILITILVAKATAINWGWYNLIGISITILVGYVISILSGGNKKDISGQTFMSMRENMIKLGKIKEDGMYIIPGKFDKSSYILVGIFIIQFLILGILQYM